MSTHEPTVFSSPIGDQLSAFVEEHRHLLASCLDGLTEAEARRRLVPSKTTLLGLVKHATFVERVWFEEAVTCRPRSESGIEADPDESFNLLETDTIESVRSGYQQVCAASKQAVEHLGPDDVAHTGTDAGRFPCGGSTCTSSASSPSTVAHAEILREQVLAARLSRMSRRLPTPRSMS